MKISVLMPTRNRLEYLPKAISSLLHQSYSNWELLIHSQGEDPSHLIPNDSRIRHWRVIPSGCVPALNFLRQFVTGHVINFAADDDEFKPDALATVVSNIFDCDWLVGQTSSGSVISGVPCTWMDQIRINHIPCPAVYWKREASDRVGLFDEECECAVDYDYWFRLWKEFGPPKFIPHVLSEYRLHSDQMTATRMEEVEKCATRGRMKALGYISPR